MRRENEVDNASLGGTHYGEIPNVWKHHGTSSVSQQQTVKSKKKWTVRCAGHKKD